jgi:cell division GTPase FtsZ
MQQEELLKEIKEKMKEIKEQLKVITNLIEKSSCKNEDKNDKTKVKKKKSLITTAHSEEARRFARECAETRTLKKNKQKTQKETKADRLRMYRLKSYEVADIEIDSQDELCGGRHSY